MTTVQKPQLPFYRHHIFVCTGSKCSPNQQGQALYDHLKNRLKQLGLSQTAQPVMRSNSSCLGVCQDGPIVCIYPEGIWYHHIDETRLERILQEHIIQGQPVTDYIFYPENTPQSI